MLKNSSNPVILGLFLGLIGALAAAVLAVVADFTREPIKKNEQAVISQALGDVMPDFNNNPGDDTVSLKSADNPAIEVLFFGGKLDGKLVAVAGRSKSLKGYSGDVEVLVGLHLDGKVRTVLVTRQNETPGLGTVVCDRKNVVSVFDLLGMGKKKEAAGLPRNPILDQFDGHSAAKGDKWQQPWKVGKDGGEAIYLTGATITSRAVTEAVYRVALTYLKNKDSIISKLNSNAGAVKK